MQTQGVAICGAFFVFPMKTRHGQILFRESSSQVSSSVDGPRANLIPTKVRSGIALGEQAGNGCTLRCIWDRIGDELFEVTSCFGAHCGAAAEPVKNGLVCRRHVKRHSKNRGLLRAKTVNSNRTDVLWQRSATRSVCLEYNMGWAFPASR